MESKERGDRASSMKRKEGCEIEARGISYKIYSLRNTYPFPFKIWSRDEDEEEEEAQKSEEDVEQAKRAVKTSSSRIRTVLHNVSCRARPWEIMAIVGPSGAGKSTLLEILSGKLEPVQDSSSTPILVNKKPIDKAKFKKMSGYVSQRDTLFPLLTVYETLLFSAKLKLRLPGSQLITRVDNLIQELGLGHVAGIRVGDDRVRGISGGERRRVSIGVEVVHDPSVLILDEPTSGLDSTSALQIVDMLKTMADTRGRTIILSIHQPGFRIVKLFNSVLLLANGAVLHEGTTHQLQAYLSSVGLQPPLHVNVVEFAIDSIDMLQQQQQQQQLHHRKTEEIHTNKTDKFTLQQLFHLSKIAVGDKEKMSSTGGDLHSVGFANSRLSETVILSLRFSKNIIRTKELFALRTLQMLVAGLVLGSIFFNLPDDLPGAESRVGLFAFILTFLLSCTTEALPIFLQEREILVKETSSGSYSVSSYVIANALVFLPFLLILALSLAGPLYWLAGLRQDLFSFLYFLLLVWLILITANSVVVCFSALVPNFIVGNSVISGVMGSFFLFSGYFISKNEIPSYWIFMHYLSLFKYPFEGFLVNEFSGSNKCLELRNGFCLVSGEDLVREEGFEEKSRWRNVVIMVAFILAYRFVSYVILRYRCSERGGLRKRKASK
ncbi:ABC transporter G family member 5 [Aristolochia californica]|uniref:ABC transporter G family member 5 n=1 Tax=Aristolochia californica TaxID=171875 RepID=UPI0035E119E7